MLTPQLIVKSLKKKYSSAVNGKDLSRDVFEGINSAINAELRSKWSGEEEKAIKLRGDYLHIYQVKGDKGDFIILISVHILNLCL